MFLPNESRLSSFGKAAFSLFSCLTVPLGLLYPVPGLGAVVGCPGAAVGEGEFAGPAVYGEGLAA